MTEGKGVMGAVGVAPGGSAGAAAEGGWGDSQETLGWGLEGEEGIWGAGVGRRVVGGLVGA